jgi:hypothetical protein
LAYRFGALKVIWLGMLVFVLGSICYMVFGWYWGASYPLFCVASVLCTVGAILINGPSISEALLTFKKNIGLAVSVSGLISYLVIPSIAEVIILVNREDTFIWGIVFSVLALCLAVGLAQYRE